MRSSDTFTLVETDKWEEIRRKLYFPVDIDEYKSSSKALTDFTLLFLSEILPCPKRPLKEGYVADLCRDGSISPCALILGLIYIQRLAHINPSYLLRTLPTDVFLTAMVVASKYLQDEGEYEALVNSEWAVIGQRDKVTVDKLEREFLSAIDWNLYVPTTEFDLFTSTIQGRIALGEASRRGWWSYTDLLSYWDTTCHSKEVMKSTTIQTTKLVSGGLATYFLCVTAIVSASQIATETKQPSSAAQLTVSLIDSELVNGSSISLLKSDFYENPLTRGEKGSGKGSTHLYYKIFNEQMLQGPQNLFEYYNDSKMHDSEPDACVRHIDNLKERNVNSYNSSGHSHVWTDNPPYNDYELSKNNSLLMAAVPLISLFSQQQKHTTCCWYTLIGT